MFALEFFCIFCIINITGFDYDHYIILACHDEDSGRTMMMIMIITLSASSWHDEDYGYDDDQMIPVRNRQVIIHEALLAQTETNFFV